MMKTLTQSHLNVVVGGATAIGGVKTSSAPFDWAEFGLVTACLTAGGALIGAVLGASDKNTRTGMKNGAVDGMLGGALLAGVLGASGDAIHQYAPTVYGAVHD